MFYKKLYALVIIMMSSHLHAAILPRPEDRYYPQNPELYKEFPYLWNLTHEVTHIICIDFDDCALDLLLAYAKNHLPNVKYINVFHSPAVSIKRPPIYLNHHKVTLDNINHADLYTSPFSQNIRKIKHECNDYCERLKQKNQSVDQSTNVMYRRSHL